MRICQKIGSGDPSGAYNNLFAIAPRRRNGRQGSRRMRGGKQNERLPFAPPENWYEPNQPIEVNRPYKIITQSPGRGYRHVVTPQEIRDRLRQLPKHLVTSLDIVQLSRMTRKKKSFPCYGMQWGAALYLYPLEDSRIEYFDRPPKPLQYNEARMYGGRWETDGCGSWILTWSESAIKDYYLNNILIHELGHLIDDRNTSYLDRERFAEWFAIEHGYRSSRAQRNQRSVRRRHHAR